MKFKNILVLYKKSAYQIYFLDHRRPILRDKRAVYRKELERFRETHEEHYKSLKIIEQVLRAKGVKYRKHARGSKFSYARYDLVIAVGGDGTFLEAARNIKGQAILGVNSDPSWSVGRFCISTIINFSKTMECLLKNKFTLKPIERLKVQLDNQKIYVNAVNDVLICHYNPASMSRYLLTIGGRTEEQKSSGIWVATAVGSSGAMYSAGGKLLSVESKQFQYKPRELYLGQIERVKLRGGILNPHQSIKGTSLMRNGVIFVDGAHVRIPFSFGQSVTISPSADKLNMIHV